MWLWLSWAQLGISPGVHSYTYIYVVLNIVLFRACLPTIGRAWGISILDLSYNVLQWTVMTTTFLRVSKLKYFLCYFTKCFL